MKRLLISVMLLASVLASAQEAQSDFKARYDRQVRNVGYAGVGVETILDRWEAAEPENPYLLEGKFHFYFTKSRSSKIIMRSESKYLGNAPVLSLKDTLGNDVNYYEDDFFVDSLFALSQTAIDKAIALEPAELAWRVDKVSALILYEKESPDLASAEILKMIDYQASAHPSWTHYGESAGDDTFILAVQEYCFTFYRYGTPGSYEAFRKISERMLKLYPKNTDFINNLGSYYLVYKENPKQALKWYGKTLKINPADYTAAHNCVILARKEKNVKLEKKYLPILIKATDDEIERQSYEARLAALNLKKK